MAVAVAEPEAIWKPTLEELQSRPVVIEVDHLDWSFGARQVLYDVSMRVHEGEIMVIMGGTGTLFGPALGAILLIGLETVLAAWTEHWQFVLGPILILLVLFTQGGAWSLLTRWRRGHDG